VRVAHSPLFRRSSPTLGALKTTSELRNAALGARTGTVCSSLKGLIETRQFVLLEREIATLEARREPEITGWLFAYKASQLHGNELLSMLRLGASMEEPRVREQVCDLAGDLGIVELLPELGRLQEDPVSFVASAASYNHAMLSA
jgi:hypothetical protein